MNIDRLDSGRVDQLITGYSPTGGMRALQSTFGNGELNRRWEQRLIPYVRLEPFGRSDPPAEAFTYITFGDGSAAVLRRVGAGDSAGRNNAHALIGPAGLLGSVALELTRWEGWLSDRQRAELPSLAGEDLCVAPEVVDTLDDEAIRCVDVAIPLISYVLSRPDACLSSIAMDPKFIVPTLRLFERVLKPLFDLKSPIRNWSFSTHELTDADQGNLARPELIFLPELLDHAGETYHRRIFFDEATRFEDRHQQPEYQWLARYLFDEYHGSGHAEYMMTMNAACASMPDIETRIQYLLDISLDRQRHIPASTYPGHQEPLPHQARPAHRLPAPHTGGGQKANSTWTQAVPGGTGYGQQYSRPPVVREPEPEFLGGASPHDVPDDEIVRLLADAKNKEEIEYRLAGLCERITHEPATKFDRWTLIQQHKILPFLAMNLCLWDLIVAYERVLQFAFGAGAKLLHQQKFFSAVEGRIQSPNVSPVFGCVVYSFVWGSPMAGHCAQLLHERSDKKISMIPSGVNRSKIGFFFPVRDDWFADLSRYKYILIPLFLVLLVSVAVVAVVFMM